MLVTLRTTDVLDLPDHLAAKLDPALVATDREHLTAVTARLTHLVEGLEQRLHEERTRPAWSGQRALDRDQEIHRLTARLRVLRRFGADVCLGRMVLVDQDEPVYVGRLGLTGEDGTRLLVDWRSPAAEPFFGATHADPMGLVSRRRYRWTLGRVTDYWDEVFTADGLAGNAALDDQSAFVASLGADRSPRMRDVLATIQADQDAIIRAGSSGALVVDGGPGTGKTVVALHRTAYLLYADPRLGHRRGGVLFVGPHRPYLAYVSDVLPGLGEEGVLTCTLGNLLPQGADAVEEADPVVAELKSSVAMVAAIDQAVRFYQEPPTSATVVSTPWGDVRVTATGWAAAFDAPDPGTPHNEAREQVWDELLDGVLDGHDLEATDEQLRAWLRRSEELTEVVGAHWPLLDAEDLVADLWSVPAFLRLCAPSLDPASVRRLQRTDPRTWTVPDLPLLDAARLLLGDAETTARERRRQAVLAAERAEMASVVDHLVAADDTEMQVMSMLRRPDAQSVIVDDSAVALPPPDVLAGPFAHVVVDEAQELTDAQWQMLLRRCPSRSITVVGDRAQARHGFGETWQERLRRVGLDRVDVATLTVNYRTPEQVMAAAEPVIRAVLPDANVPTSVRRGEHPVRYGARADLDEVIRTWLATHPGGIACVVGDPTFEPAPRVTSLTPELVKGLEFDLVVLVDPHRFGDGVEGAVDRYVAMTRATQQLVVLTG